MIHRTPQRRSGVAIIMALVLMATLAVVFAAVTLQIVSQRRLLRERERELQSIWLARAGVEIAAGRLLDGPVPFSEENYVTPEGKVHIETKKSGADSYAISVAAVAETKEDLHPMAHDLRVHFRRLEKAGKVSLQLSSDK